ncbi:hypothetical protein QTP88_020259 [Uroleucon formosanum]
MSYLTYIENTSENRAFKSSARESYLHSDVEGVVDRDFTALLAKEDSYAGKNSGFALSCVDGMLLGVYEYTPMGGSSYLALPQGIVDRKAVINPQNIDLQCFKWAILAKHVPHDNRTRVSTNYLREEHCYDFSTLSVPTPVSEIELFERANPSTSVNLYGVRKCKNNKNKKSATESAAYPLRVVDNELPDHFDILLITGSGEKSHYTDISDFSRLVSMQKNSREHRLFFCKKCFTSFDDQPLRYKLHGEEALARHRLVCGTHKPILPILPPKGSTLEFNALCKTQRLLFVMYADFEALLVKSTQRHGVNTEALHTHQPMSYGFICSTSRGLRSFFRGSDTVDDVAKRFVIAVIDMDVRAHGMNTVCDLCAKTFTDVNCKVHRVLQFRQSRWLAPYIALNTGMRARAANNFEEQFFKDTNNSVFGKTMKSMRKRIKVELVSRPARKRKLINRPAFKQCTNYSENLATVTMHKKEIYFCKPIYIGFVILERSKELMDEYNYNVMKRHYGDNISLLYTDTVSLFYLTDSLIYHMNTPNFYDHVANNPNLLNRMDTSNLPPDHRCYTLARMKLPDYLKDEISGRNMHQFIGLRAKSYAYDIEVAINIRSKGVRGHVNHLTFDDHMRCLFADDDENDHDGSDANDYCDKEFEEPRWRLTTRDCARIAAY